MLAHPVNAEKALAKGLVTEIANDNELRRATCRFAGGLTSGPRLAYRLIKRNVEAAAIDFDCALDLEAVSQASATMSPDHREARLALAERRPPRSGASSELRSART
jgi:2-(1,2-epoxy-1,2-dihydrophenyl)acetyl-CoA isomerase